MFTAALTMTLLLPQPALAQEGRTALALRLRNGWSHEARPGKNNNFSLEVRNTGTRPITNIRLSSEKPEGWIIEFKPAEINYLSSGSLQTVDVNIKPVSKAFKEEYRVSLIAEANEIRVVQYIWITVKAASFWLWIWAVIGAIVIAGFVFIYMRYGRQKLGT